MSQTKWVWVRVLGRKIKIPRPSSEGSNGTF